MSFIVYLKEMTPTRVKAKERNDVNLDKLVRNGFAGVVPPQPVYADLTNLPESRGEAAQRILDLTNGVPHALVSKLLTLPPSQALQQLREWEIQASKRNDSTMRKEQILPSKPVSNADGQEVDPEGVVRGARTPESEGK